MVDDGGDEEDRVLLSYLRYQSRCIYNSWYFEYQHYIESVGIKLQALRCMKVIGDVQQHFKTASSGKCCGYTYMHIIPASPFQVQHFNDTLRTIEKDIHVRAETSRKLFSPRSACT